MSVHPLGPWSSTEGGFFYKGGSGSISMKIGSTKARSGFNNGKRVSTPSSASCQVVEYEAPTFYKATFRNYYTGKPNPSVPTNELGCFLVSPWDASSNFSANFALKQATIDSYALSALLQKQAAAFQSLVAMGEMKDTLRTVKEVTGLMAGKHNQYAKLLLADLGKLKGAAIPELIRVIAAANLQYRFGIAPLVRDVQSLAEAAAKTVLQEPPKLHVTASWFDFSTYADKPCYVNAGACSGTTRTNHTAKLLSKMGYSLSLGVASTRGIADRNFGFSLYDIAPAGWEILPYSWLVDYVTNMSDFFYYFSSRKGIVSSGWKVSIFEAHYQSTFTPERDNSFGANPLISATVGSQKGRSFSFNRQPYSMDNMIPVLRVEIPTVKQTANVLSLAARKFIDPSKTYKIRDVRVSNGVRDLLRGG